MRNTVFAVIVVTSVIAPPAWAQQTGPNQQTQQEADKGIKTRNSGDSGLVGDQDRAGASAHPPGQPNSSPTTGSNPSTGSSQGSQAGGASR
jgi:hypothetical protein